MNITVKILACFFIKNIYLKSNCKGNKKNEFAILKKKTEKSKYSSLISLFCLLTHNNINLGEGGVVITLINPPCLVEVYVESIIFPAGVGFTHVHAQLHPKHNGPVSVPPFTESISSFKGSR